MPAFTYKRLLDTFKNVDVIWFKEGFPAYCFEVEHTTGVTSGLLRLFQISSFASASFYIVAPSNTFTKFKTEVSKDPFYKIKERYNFRSYDELIEFYTEAKVYHQLKKGFLEGNVT